MGPSDLEGEFAPTTADQVLSALETELNRYVVWYFRESDESVATLDELVEYVATNHDGSDLGNPEHVSIRLWHAGLPKLADRGVLEYDRRSETVRWRGHPVLETDVVDELLDRNQGS